jgi:eukaryotic-like serine/threonine-protein kinase
MSRDSNTGTISHIGRYDVVGEIGRGGMGIVYRGEDKLIGRDVAIKTLTEVTPELRERFYVEARSGILNHPNIVTVYEFGDHEGSPFIAMEYLAGESLDKMLRTRGRLSVLETLSIVEQLCAGLGYAHQNGLLHRDVKPANVIVLPDGRVKIVDFGIARLADRDTRLTKTDALLGTFSYIAPERLKGEASDGRSDIWSVGVMLYEMLSGELPFKGKDVSALYRVMHEPYVPLSQFVQDVPEACSVVLDKALAKDVDTRYSTMEEMAFDLQAIGDGLKQERVQELLESGQRLVEERQFANARSVLLQAQRIDPANARAKALMQEVQDHLSHLQRGEQLRQILEQAEDAVTALRYEDAIAHYEQAKKLDVEGTLGLTERLEQVRALKEQFFQVRTLSEQAGEARRRGDLTAAQNLLEQALQLDEKNTGLRSAQAILLREIRRKEEGFKVEDLLRSAREEYNTRKYTEAIARLREAAEIDPTHSEVQELLITATTRQKEERRRVLLDQVVAEIQDCLGGEDFDRAQDRVNRALETLPSETLLLSLKTEIEQKKREFETQKIVRSALLRAQELMLEQPVNAMAIVDEALKQVPQEESLLQFRSRLEEHLGRVQKEEMRTQLLKNVHDEIEAGRFEDAIRKLESESKQDGATEEVESLLGLARSGQKRVVDRIEAILNQARALAGNDVAGALQFFSSQPQEILANEKVVALRKELTQKAELKRVIDTAVARCEKLLEAGDLNGSMNEFARIAKAHGASAELAEAKERCEKKRQAAANALIHASFGAARAAVRNGSGKNALQELQRVKQMTQFASEAVRAEWQKLREEAKDISGRKAATSQSNRAATTKKSRMGMAGALGLVIALCAGAGVWKVRHHSAPSSTSSTAAAVSAPSAVSPSPAAAPVVKTYLVVNASPWATVMGIQSSDGKRLDLGNADRATPFRLDGVPEGQYDVSLKGADDRQQVLHCAVNSGQHLCEANPGTPDLSTSDMQQILMGEQP